MKMPKWIALFLLLLVPASSAPPPLATRIRALIQRSPIARTAFWGIEVRDLATGAAVYRLNDDHFFVPASNTKLFTTALALSRLGPDYRIHTTVTAEAAPDAQGRIAGDLTLMGAGDANLSGRVIPYDVNAEKGDPLTAIQDLAAQLYQHGVRHIDGDVIGDDTAFLWEPYGQGWGIDDPLGTDGAPVSALCVNDNSITMNVLASSISFDPPLPAFTIENRIQVIEGGTNGVHVNRLPGSNVLQIWGAVPPSYAGQTFHLAVDDPARYAALALIEAMTRQGITVGGKAVAHHALPGVKLPDRSPQTVLAERQSPPLIDDLRVTDKVSQNLHAEMLLRLVGQGNRRAGLEALQQFLEEAGVDPEQVGFQDGSGLSRRNLVTPHAIVTLLTYMAKSPLAESWTSLLPIAGVDGSLHARFEKTRAKGRLVGKTGSLSHTSALSGYATRRNGRRLVYSVIVNNYNGPASEIHDTIDRICSLMVE